MPNPVTALGARQLGGEAPCYLIAEVGTTCLGDMDKALALVEAGATAGVDAVKFQVIDPGQVSDPSATYKISVGGKETQVNMKEMFERLVFSEEQWRRIAARCRERSVDFFATVDYTAGVDLLERVGVAVHKIGAWDTTFRPLIECIGRTGKPMFVDLGPTTETEIDDIVAWFKKAGGRQILFLHDFHTEDDRQMNLRAISRLQSKFPQWPVGFSAPARDDDLDIAALGLGAAYIEKRLILSRSEAAFHAHESLEPEELKHWVQRIRHIERALGKAAVAPSAGDLAGKKLYYRSVCSLAGIRKGERFSTENLGGKRPGSGLPTARLPELWGRTATRDIAPDKLLTEDDIA